MATIRPVDSVKLIVGMLSNRRERFALAAEALSARFGPIDVAGPVLPFDYTDYYTPQMGPNLLRQFLSFERLIAPDALAAVKGFTNELERQLADAGDVPRPINLDPGYVTPGKLVLASAKDFAHRVYLGEGIYAEVTLTFVRGRWVAGPFTFPDYASGAYDAFLTAVRERLMEQTRKPGKRQQAAGNR